MELRRPGDHATSSDRHTLATLDEAGRALSSNALETRVDLSRARLETMLKVLDVDGAVHRVNGGWEPTGQPWSSPARTVAPTLTGRFTDHHAMPCRLHLDRIALFDTAVARLEAKTTALHTRGQRTGSADEAH